MTVQRIYTIEQPDTSEYEFTDLLKDALNNAVPLNEIIHKSSVPEYLHWKYFKYKKWIPEGYKNKKEKLWGLIQFFRKTNAIVTPIRDAQGNYFTWEKLDRFDRLFHEIDLDMSKYLFDYPGIAPGENKKFLMNGLIEEAIASSQLEGAHTTRKVAKQMIEEKRPPATHAEKMIFNNYITMTAIEEKFKDEPLSLEMIHELHRTLTVGTMPESEQGLFRSPQEQIVVQKSDDPNVISYVAPPIDFAKKELLRFIDFANDALEEKKFVHPLIKAIMLHFWMGLLHPFTDGNGRLARGLFYWYLLRKGYHAFAFLPISIAIKRAPSQYSEAYVLSEQDNNNLTYFIDYHMKKIWEAIEGFRNYLKKKSTELQKIDQALLLYKDLNKRQMQVLIELRNNTSRLLNVTAYRNIYNVAKATAINDLKHLVRSGYLQSQKKGRNVYYFLTPKAEKIR